MKTDLLTATSPISAKYWSELKDLSDSVKLELISLLSNSMVHTEKKHPQPQKGWASRFAGTWKDSRSAEEIINDIRTNRTTNTIDIKL